ncbi:MAG: amidohydrolase [Deltaproteobacteria bacterium]|nr:amidohydrolase [Deltaproteobacteria bacterium]
MIIDIHSHIYPRRYLDILAERTEIPRLEVDQDGEHFIMFPDEKRITGGTRAIGEDYTSVEKKIFFMDQSGIDVSVISLGNPWVDFFEKKEAAWWASSLNEEIESICSTNDRLEGLGVVPLQDISAACDEIKRVVRLSHIHGIIMGTRPGNMHLDHTDLDPFWEAAQRDNVPIFIHPHYIVGAEWMAGYGHAMLIALGFPFETTAAVTRLILGGVLERHPDITLILAHSGGALPFLSGRLDVCTQVDGRSSRNLEMPFSRYLKKLYYDAVAYNRSNLLCTLDLVGPGRVFFGTDHPFGIANPTACKKAIQEATSSEEQASAILGDNAKSWLEGAMG